MWSINVVLVLLAIFTMVVSVPQVFTTVNFKVGIEYDHSLPMSGGSDRYRHRHNYDPFFVTVTTTAKNGFVIAYLQVRAIVDDGGNVDFHVIRGEAGSRSMAFQLVSNQSDFLSYSYLAYGIREEEYKKITNIIQLPLPTPNYASVLSFNILSLSLFIVLYPFLILS